MTDEVRSRLASPWIPELPIDWQTMQLRRVAAFRNGADYKAVEVESGGYPAYGSGGEFRRVSDFLYDGTSVLFGRKGTVDRPLLVSGRFWTVDTMFYTELSPAVDARYLHYYATTMPFDYYRTNTAVPSMTQADLAGHVLPVPPLNEQRAIADYLDRETAQIDTLIAKQEQLIATLRERFRSVLDAFAASTVGTPAKLKRLFRPSSETSRGDEEVLSVFREHGVVVKSARDGNFNRTPEDVSRYLRVREGDLVVNKMKAWQGSLGISPYDGIVSGDYEVAHPVDGRLVPEFAHAYLRSPRMVSEYAMRSTGIRPAQWRLYWDQLGSVEIPVPDHVAQRRALAQLNNQTSGMDILIAKAERFIELAKERRDALITAVVTGQIDVTATA